MFSLKNALACIEAMKANGTYRGHKVGFLKKDVTTTTTHLTGLPSLAHGKIVLFKDEDREVGDQATVTVETPMSQKEIEEQKKRGSLLTTYGCIVCVPIGFVEEIEV